MKSKTEILAQAERSVLADALAQLDAARQAAAGARSAAERGRAAVEVAEAALATFGAVDTEVAEHRAAALRAGAGQGTLPAELATRRLEQRQAAEEAADASRASALLDQEAAAADEGEKRAVEAVAAASFDVRLAVAADLARRLSDADREAARLRLVAASFLDSITWIDRERSKVPSHLALLREDGQHSAMMSLVPHGAPAEATAAWNSFSKALRADPTAPVPTPLA